MALSLSRKIGESIRISDNIVVTLVEADRGKARRCADAPQEVEIWREELYAQREDIKQSRQYRAGEGRP